MNELIKKYGYKKYLEIGVEDGDCIRRINCELKHGVDPASNHATHKMPSDDFFASLGPQDTYDLYFIDGLHVDEQVYKDITNALNHLSPNGTIVLHDCNPPTEWHQRSYEEAKKNGCRLWNGTTWKAFVRYRMERPDLDMHVIDTDWGCGMIREGTQETLKIQEDELTYKNLAKNRKEWLNLMCPTDFRRLHSTLPSPHPQEETPIPVETGETM